MRFESGQHIGVETAFGVSAGGLLSEGRRDESGFGREVGFRLETRVGVGSGSGIALIIRVVIILICGVVYLCSRMRSASGQDVRV